MEQISWFYFSISATVLFGVMAALYKVPSFKNQSRHVALFWAVATSFVLSLILFSQFLYLASPGMIIAAFIWGGSFTLLTMLQMYALKHIDTNTLFPITGISALILAVVLGFIFFQENISLLQFLGIILVIFVVYFYLYKKKKFQYSKQILIVGSGIVFFSVFNKILQKIMADAYDIHAYQIFQYLGAVIFSFLLILYFHKKDFKKHFTKASLFSGSLIGLFSFLGGYATLIALTKGPFTLITSIHSLYILITALTGAALFKEKLTKKIIALLILSVIAVIMIKIG